MEPQAHSPHVLIFPLPALGHVTSMLKLAELLSVTGLKITFLNSEHNHERLVRRHSYLHSHFVRYPGFEFETIWDGLPPDHPRVGNAFPDIFGGLYFRTKPIFREMLVKMKPPVDCIIGDGVLGFVVDIADELGIPILQFHTVGASSAWACFSILDMIEAGDLPIKDVEISQVCAKPTM
ncbi:UDP-glucuronosyl/UDP-glucosyltransferase [Corchorus olitorius]|uniref:UDP-glucuronosyl/UDP-glucosyltransferase n=1 Tax=Corchorus olitorius TaxID=93759 RepID=A0A1R3I1A0_9ROSI|nr:UDP-glucuronosyl/UDP-glucosyltransferase [Corchorus olitorius]